MLGFEQYAKIKNNYCLNYLGHSPEFLVQLKLLRPIIERQLSDLKLYIGCRDDAQHWLDGKIVKASELKLCRENFVFMRNLEFDGINHPVEQLLEECGITQCVVHSNPLPSYGVGVILPGLNDSVVRNITRYYSDKNYRIEVGGDPRGGDFVIGKESPEFYEAAGIGLPSVLVGLSLGSRLYKKMFPFGENFKP